MKATIGELWNTGRELISFDNNDTKRPQTFSDLKNCDNVLLGDKIDGTKIREVMIDNRIYLVEPIKVNHPQGGTMCILEVN